MNRLVLLALVAAFVIAQSNLRNQGSASDDSFLKEAIISDLNALEDGESDNQLSEELSDALQGSADGTAEDQQTGRWRPTILIQLRKATVKESVVKGITIFKKRAKELTTKVVKPLQERIKALEQRLARFGDAARLSILESFVKDGIKMGDWIIRTEGDKITVRYAKGNGDSVYTFYPNRKVDL